jgi:hypothetical protein
MSTLTSVKPAIDLSHFNDDKAAGAKSSARLCLQKLGTDKSRFQTELGQLRQRNGLIEEE